MTIAALVLAFFKVRLVIMYFMEVRADPLAFRMIFETWLLLLCGVLSWMYYTAEA